MSHAPIAVVGAGMAGLSCAQRLVQAGCRVHLFDKSRGPSGRMSTRRAQDPEGGWQCDHGAPGFTASDPDFLEEVLRWEQAGVAARWQARTARHDGQSLHRTETPAQFVGTARMTAPAAHLLQQLTCAAQPVQMQLQTTVQHLQADGTGWRLGSAEHGLLPERYRAVLVAIPAPQAQALLASAVPQAAALAASVRMQACWVLMVRSDRPVPWPCDSATIDSGPLCQVVRDSSKPGRAGPETWILHASPAWSAAHVEDDAANVTQALLQAFADIGGPPPDSVRATAHRWRYANAAPALAMGCWWDPACATGLCGDWLHGGGVEGAWLSGRALAGSALATLTV